MNIMDFFQNLAHFLFEMVNGIASHSISGRLDAGYLALMVKPNLGLEPEVQL